MTDRVKNRKKVWIRPFLAQLLSMNIRQVSRLFNGAMGRIDVLKVKAYLDNNGYRPPMVPRREYTRERKLEVKK